MWHYLWQEKKKQIEKKKTTEEEVKEEDVVKAEEELKPAPEESETFRNNYLPQKNCFDISRLLQTYFN